MTLFFFFFVHQTFIFSYCHGDWMWFKWFCALLWNNLSYVKSFFFFQWYTLWIEQIKEAARKGIFMQCDKYIHRAGWCHNVSNLEVLARRWVVSRDCSCSMEGSCLSLGNCLICLFGCFFFKKYWGWDRICSNRGFPGGSMVKNPLASAGGTTDASSRPESGRSPGEENDNPLQCSCLGNPTDRGAWWAIVHVVAKESDTDMT